MLTRGKAPETVHAYLAGIIDGEGHIGINRSVTTTQRRTTPRYQPELTIVNSNRRLIDWLHDTFGGSVKDRKKQRDYHKQTWAWKVGDRKAAALLAAVLPYLIAKHAQAEMVVRFFRDATPRTHGRGVQMTDEECARRQTIYEGIRALNDSRHRPQRLSGEAPTTVGDAIV